MRAGVACSLVVYLLLALRVAYLLVAGGVEIVHFWVGAVSLILLALLCIVVCVKTLYTYMGQFAAPELFSVVDENSQAQRAVVDACDALGVHRVPQVFTTTANVSPVIVGVFETRIILPSTLLGPNSSDNLMRAVVSHEVAHIKNQDLYWQGIAKVFELTLFPNPLGKEALACLRTLAEKRADLLAARYLGFDEGFLSEARQKLAPNSKDAVEESGSHQNPQKRGSGVLSLWAYTLATAIGLVCSVVFASAFDKLLATQVTESLPNSLPAGTPALVQKTEFADSQINLRRRAELPPLGQRSYFCGVMYGVPGFYAANADLSKGALVVDSAVGLGLPSIDMAEQKIAFQKAVERNPDIFVYDVTAGKETRLTNHPAEDCQPRISSDGKYVLFFSNRDGYYETYVIEIRTRRVTRLTHTPNQHWSFEARWGPNDLTVLFTRGFGNYSEIAMVNRDGSGYRQLTKTYGATTGGILSADAKFLVYATTVKDGLHLWRLDLTTGRSVQITFGPGLEAEAAFTADGNRVLFTRTVDGKHQICSVALNGENLRELTNLGCGCWAQTPGYGNPTTLANAERLSK